MVETVAGTGMPPDRETDVSLSERIVAAVADEEGVDPEELSTPLYEVVDPDALEALREQPASVATDPRPTITFPYCGYSVTVSGEEVSLSERV